MNWKDVRKNTFHHANSCIYENNFLFAEEEAEDIAEDATEGAEEEARELTENQEELQPAQENGMFQKLEREYDFANSINMFNFSWRTIQIRSAGWFSGPKGGKSYNATDVNKIPA